MVKQAYKKDSGIIKIGKQLFTNVKYEDLNFVDVLGAGQYGTVSKCKLYNNIIAVKMIAICDEEEEKLCRDLDVMMKCTNCSHIVSFYGYIITRDNIYICMETMAMCLEKLYKNYIKPFDSKISEGILGKINVYVIKALKDLKDEYHIIHGDIKPSNILIDWDGSIKLCDFGISGMLINSCANTPIDGTVAYSSPERLCSLQYDVRADVWSLGITLVELATCKHPYENIGQMELEIMVRSMPGSPFFHPSPSLPDTYSMEFQEFVNSCLQKDVLCRPKYKNLVNFKWYQSHRRAHVDLGFWFEHVLEPPKEVSTRSSVLL